ncbi:LOW QUALITY PROTEIN: Integrase, catalytic core protein [Phytophthora megakarya]|uniref:Integrase, catalytic core protein n=1 Tax=Phytophthora megakarya TaxID=4795 RepID=A0A225VYU6_9STRA|nr:LOW QUALITY PROTEIN: Integrase, catalytic core protein [Phytophthora megakarya]
MCRGRLWCLPHTSKLVLRVSGHSGNVQCLTNLTHCIVMAPGSWCHGGTFRAKNGSRVFVVKRDECGRIRRFKPQLVIHGFKQCPALEFTETYAPVTRFETIRAAIYFALQHCWAILQ